jgi:hypothetical protein
VAFQGKNKNNQGKNKNNHGKKCISEKSMILSQSTLKGGVKAVMRSIDVYEVQFIDVYVVQRCTKSLD